MPIFVNKVEISDEAVFQEMQHHPAPTREDARDEAARALLIREILRQEAIEKEFLGNDADEDAIDAATMKLIEQEVTTPEADSAACKRYYLQNLDRFTPADTEGSTAPLPFEAVENRIRDYLHTRSIRHGIQSYILDLASKAKVAGFDLAATL